jgi:hypothetical protein
MYEEEKKRGKGLIYAHEKKFFFFCDFYFIFIFNIIMMTIRTATVAR